MQLFSLGEPASRVFDTARFGFDLVGFYDALNNCCAQGRRDKHMVVNLLTLSACVLPCRLMRAFFDSNETVTRRGFWTKACVQLSSGATMYDIAYLPALLFASGVGTSSPMLQSWEGQMQAELHRRAARKRECPPALGPEPGCDEPNHAPQLETQPDVPATPSGAASSLTDTHVGRPEMVLEFPTHTNTNQAGHDQSSQLAIVLREQAEPPNTLQRLGARKMSPADLAAHTDPDRLMEFFNSLTKPQLCSLALRQTTMIRNQQQQMRMLRNTAKTNGQKIRRLVSRLASTKSEVHKLKRPEREDLDVFRGKGRKLTWRGSVSLGLRKAITLVSASSYPQASLLAISRWTVTRGEILVGALLIARAWVFNQIICQLLANIANIRPPSVEPETQTHPDAPQAESMGSSAIVTYKDEATCSEAEALTHDDAMADDLNLPRLSLPAYAFMFSSSASGVCEDVSTNPMCVGATYWCGDATNSSIWQRQKLQGLLAVNVLLVDWRALQSQNYGDAFRSLKSM